MKFKNLSILLSLYLIISVTVFSLILIFIGYRYVRESTIGSYLYRIQYDCQEVNGDVKKSLDEADRFSKNIRMDYNNGHLINDQRRYMEMAFKVQSNLVAFGIETAEEIYRLQLRAKFKSFYPDGILKTDAERFRTGNTDINRWINQMLYNSRPEWSNPFYDVEKKSRTIIYSQPLILLTPEKELTATIFCSVSLEPILRNLKHQRLISPGYSILLNEKNQIVYHPDSTKTGISISSLYAYIGGNKQADIGHLIESKAEGYQIVHSGRTPNSDEILFYWPLKHSNWSMIAVIPESLLMAQYRKIAITLVLVVLFFALLTIAVTTYFSVRLVSPISGIANDSSKIAVEAGYDPVSNLNDVDLLSDSIKKLKVHLAQNRIMNLQVSYEREELDKELRLANNIEMSIIPTKFPLYPERSEFDCYGKLIPAKIVGGDMFDLFLLDENLLFISICDTLGKGFPAAMFSVIARTFILGIADPHTRPGAMIESLNNGLCLGLEADMFSTFLMGTLNLKTGEFIYSNAGHPQPIVLRNNQTEQILVESHGIPLGLKRNLHYSESTILIEPGESLIIYTDGITEEFNSGGIAFGVERLIETIHPLHFLPTIEIVNKTLETIEHFRGGAEVSDDTTLVAIKYLGA